MSPFLCVYLCIPSASSSSTQTLTFSQFVYFVFRSRAVTPHSLSLMTASKTVVSHNRSVNMKLRRSLPSDTHTHIHTLVKRILNKQTFKKKRKSSVIQIVKSQIIPPVLGSLHRICPRNRKSTSHEASLNTIAVRWFHHSYWRRLGRASITLDFFKQQHKHIPVYNPFLRLSTIKIQRG